MFVQKRMLLRSIAAVLIAGGCWWLSFDLGLHWWWPIWLAPVPVLWVAQRLSGWGAFGAAFLAFLIGRCAWLPFLVSVLPVGPALIFTVLPAVCFALAVLPARVFLRRRQPVLAALSFAALWTTVEFLLALFGRDGTIVSIAYTQSSFLPVVQVAALTGVAGISFVLCFVPALVAARKWVWAAGVVMLVVGFGSVRYHMIGSGRLINSGSVTVGMVSLDERVYKNGIFPKSDGDDNGIIQRYVEEIGKLAQAGARLVLLPEKAVPVRESALDRFRGAMTGVANQYGIRIIVGYTVISPKPMRNMAGLFEPGGVVKTYEKVHLFEGEAMEGFSHGSAPGVFGEEGLAICKDYDFEPYMREYGKAGVAVMYDPAWDFVRDGWWHSRIAIVGAVANGYSLVRNAREGRMTISDDRGYVYYEASSEGKKLTTMIGSLELSAHRTLYARWGDWFGWLTVATAAVVLIYLAASRSLTRV
jgi:apolipoprotein N-acyltransferase